MSFKYSSFTATKSNVLSNGYNNTLEVQFAGNIATFKNAQVALRSLTLYNSSFNINANLYQNNTFSLKIPFSGGYSTIALNLPNGYFSYSDINSYIQSQLIAAGAYLINPTGYWYPIQLTANSTLYAAQFDMALCYTTLPAGWSYPASGVWAAGGLPSVAYTVQITIPSGMSSILGFNIGSYPSTLNYPTVYSVTSNVTPQINPVSSYFLTCSLINNRMNVNPNILASFTSGGTSIGQTININPNEFAWISVINQSVQSVRFTILDQNYNFVQLADPQIVVDLLIREQV